MIYHGVQLFRERIKGSDTEFTEYATECVFDMDTVLYVAKYCYVGHFATWPNKIWVYFNSQDCITVADDFAGFYQLWVGGKINAHTHTSAQLKKLSSAHGSKRNHKKGNKDAPGKDAFVPRKIGF